jgi:hypothetical protein
LGWRLLARPRLKIPIFSKVEIQTVPVADGIYMLLGEGGNIGVSVGEDGVFIFHVGPAHTDGDIPGQGPVASRADLQRYRDMMATVADRVKELKQAGKSRDEVIAAKPTAETRVST